jgi:hypothetical protein
MILKGIKLKRFLHNSIVYGDIIYNSYDKLLEKEKYV